MEKTCASCKYWADTFGEKEVAVLGYCSKLEPGHLITPYYRADQKTGDAGGFVTSCDFGCNQHESE